MGEVVKLPFKKKDIMKKLTLYLVLLLAAFVTAELDHSLQDATEPEALKNDIVDPKESLEQIEEDESSIDEDKVEVPETDENVINNDSNDDLSDLDRWSRSCRDRDRRCANWGRRNYCNIRFRRWMKRNCKKTCGRCGRTRPLRRCRDNLSFCRLLARRNLCNSRRQGNWMRRNCRKACGRC